MRRRSKACLLLIPLVLMLAGTAACRHYKLYINSTSSLPRGVYQLLPKEKIARGDVVLVVDLDEIGVDRALCPYRGLLKQAAAFGGDAIDSDGKHIFVNGRKLSYSDLFTRDKYGKDLPQSLYRPRRLCLSHVAAQIRLRLALLRPHLHRAHCRQSALAIQLPKQAGRKWESIKKQRSKP